MSIHKFKLPYILFIFLFFISMINSVEAIECGISCPEIDPEHTFLSFILREVCLLGNWVMCHPIAFVIFFIIGLLIWYLLQGRE